MSPDHIELRFENGFWLGAVKSQFGLLEVVVGGGPTAPDPEQLGALQRFQSGLDGNILRLRRQLRPRLLFRPIRIAVNTENRVGVQFRNSATGNQSSLILEQPQGKDVHAVAGAILYSIDGKTAYSLLPDSNDERNLDSRRALASFACVLVILAMMISSPGVPSRREPQYPAFDPFIAAVVVLAGLSIAFGLLSAIRNEALWPLGAASALLCSTPFVVFFLRHAGRMF